MEMQVLYSVAQVVLIMSPVIGPSSNTVHVYIEASKRNSLLAIYVNQYEAIISLLKGCEDLTFCFVAKRILVLVKTGKFMSH
jgi:hypothetical protein